MNGRFLFFRMAQMLVTLAVMSFLVYTLIGLMPGDPVDLMMAGNPHLTPEQVHALDEAGNHNGRFDVGDYLALLDREGE